MRQKPRYEVLIEKKEICRVIVYAATPEEAQEKAMEEERRGDVEFVNSTDAHCVGCTVV